MKKVRLRHKIFIGIAALTVLLNGAAWSSTSFCDAYITYIFPAWVNTYGRLTGLLPFSVGEWMLAAGVILVLLAACGAAVCLVLFLWEKFAGRRAAFRWKRLAESFYRFFAWVLLAVCLIMTLNCFILYHASAFSERYFGEDREEYTLEDLFVLYNRIAEQCNSLAEQVPRDGEGNVLYQEEREAGTKTADMEEKAVEAMKELGKAYPQLDGYYPRPKALLFSDFMCQQYMQGYYFPFSMEANYNNVMYIMNKPAAMCHELAHLRGYIFEDEANFISYLACIQSEDKVFQYSGYLSVLPYVAEDMYKALGTSPEAYEAAAEKLGIVGLSEQVYEDNVFVTKEEWERINGEALLDTETVDELSDAFIDTTLKINGVADGAVSYSRVVRLLLQYDRYVMSSPAGSEGC